TQCLAQKQAALDAGDHRFWHDDRISHSPPPRERCGASEARPKTIATKVCGTRMVSAIWTTRKATIAAMPKKWTTRANSEPPKSQVSHCSCTGFQMLSPDRIVTRMAASTPQ